jgi:hypothetical protein
MLSSQFSRSILKPVIVASLLFESLCATAEGNIPRLIIRKMLEEDDAGRHAPYRHSVDEPWTVKEYYKARCASQQLGC